MRWEAGSLARCPFIMTLTPHRPALTPRSGIILDRHYVFRFCSPSRSAFQTGRNPIHVNVINNPIGSVNLSHPDVGFSGIPRNMTVCRVSCTHVYQPSPFSQTSIID